MDQPPQFVWIGPDVQTAWLFIGIGKRLASEGWHPVFIVQTEQDAAHFRSELGGVGTVVTMPDYYAEIIDGSVRPDVLQRASALEDEFGVTLLRSMVLPNRHLGRDYQTGNDHFPKSKVYARRSLAASLNACVTSFEFWKGLHDKYPPALALNYSGGGGITGRPVPLLARKHKFPYRNLTYTRFGDRFYWAHDEMAGSPAIVEAFNFERMIGIADTARIEGMVGKQILTSPEIVARLHRRRSLYPMAKEAARMVAQYAYWHLKGYAKAKRGYYLASQLMLRPHERAGARWLDRNCVRSLDDVKGRPIVYFALQVEPEMTSYLFSEYRTDQLGLLRELSLSVPAGHVIVVKEHPWAQGRRGKVFHRAIKALPNVVFVHPDYPSVDIIKAAVAVCSGSSSVNYEAAVLGKLVFHTHRGGPLECLPHAFLLDGAASFIRMAATLRKPPSTEATRQADGLRFFKALESISFPAGDKGFLNRKVPPSDDEVERACAMLYRSLHECSAPGTAQALPAMQGRQPSRLES